MLDHDGEQTEFTESPPSGAIRKYYLYELAIKTGTWVLGRTTLKLPLVSVTFPFIQLMFIVHRLMPGSVLSVMHYSEGDTEHNVKECQWLQRNTKQDKGIDESFIWMVRDGLPEVTFERPLTK